MSRPLRIEYPGAWYHVMNRGANWSRIYTRHEDYNLFLKVVEEACLLFNVSISSYCLMSNHYHLVVHTPEGNLSRYMRHVNGVYTQRFNRKYKKDGSLFRGRYKAILIQADEYLTQVVKYVHQNPLKAKMTNELDGYKWSSHRTYLKGKSSIEWLDVNSVLMLFSSKRKTAIIRYKEFMETQVDDEVVKFYSKNNQGSMLGDKIFREWIKKNHVFKDKKAELEIAEKRQIQGEKRIDIIKKEVCNKFNIDKTSLSLKKRGEENIPRLFAISLTRELSGLSFPEIAEEFNTSSYKTIATNNFRLKEKLKKNKKLSLLYKKLKSACSHEET